MEPLITNRRILIWLCIYPAANTASNLDKMWHIAFTVVVLFGQFCGTVPHFVYFCMNITGDLEGSLTAFMGFTSYLVITYIMLSCYLQRKQISQIFAHLTNIYDSRKQYVTFPLNIRHLVFNIILFCVCADANADSFQFLAHANDISEQMCTYYIKYVKLILIFNFLGCIISTFVSCKIIGHFDVNYVIHLTKISLELSHSFLYSIQTRC